MTPARPAMPDAAEEELVAMFREEIRAARRMGQRVAVVAEVTVAQGKIVCGYVQPARKVLDVVPQRA
jgi:hypothetical protein